MAMRRIVAFAGFLVLASLQVAAQRGGGGHGSAGGHSGFSGGSHFSGGGPSFAGVRSGSGLAPRASSRGSAYRSPLTARSYASRNYGSRPRNNSTSLRLRTYGYGSGYGRRGNYGYRNNCYGIYGCGYGYPWIGAGLDPYWWWDSGSSYDQEQLDQLGLANEMNQQSLDEQRMRQQTDQDVYARATPPPQPRQAERTQISPPTVLVFRDQHKEEIQNYAIIGQTLWNFAPQRTEKIPLSDLDLPATTKENDERGLDFRLPASGEGQ